jgi:2-amino-4-hydroxy-6-hydroxymethyldihydropteridine diphosphokinase
MCSGCRICKPVAPGLVEETTTAFIGLGSNLGDGSRILKSAWDRIGEIEGVTLSSLSHPYLTAPVDMESSNWFTNAVGMLQTTSTVRQLLENLLHIEFEFGRRRAVASTGYQDRSLDLDILCYGETVVDTPELVLPHPRLARRLFVLAPFAEIAPGYRERADGMTISEICAQLFIQMQTGQIPWQEIKKGEWEE